MNHVIKKSDGRYYCTVCENEGKSTSFAMIESIFRHRRTCHGLVPNKKMVAPKLIVAKPKQICAENEHLSQTSKSLNINPVTLTNLVTLAAMTPQLMNLLASAAAPTHVATTSPMITPNPAHVPTPTPIPTPASIPNLPAPLITPKTPNAPKTTITKQIKIKKLAIPSALKDDVWVHYIGDRAKSLCWCCNRIEIRMSSFHVGHVVSEANGGKAILENLRPICSRCNHGMGTNDMRDYGFAFKDSKLYQETFLSVDKLTGTT